MTHDERISSYIDNELTLEQEQEFLISLAASDGLRKSFRSELVLKKVLHRDESSVNPPHTLRRSVFAAIGLAGAEMVGSEHANAATQAATKAVTQAATKSAFKTIFATKVSTLITAAGLGVSAMAGYGLHSVISPAPVTPAPVVMHAASPVAPLDRSQAETAIAAPTPQVQDNHQRAATVRHRMHESVKLASTPKAAADPVSGVAGGGPIILDQPKIGTK
ncbi:MAG: hypothetical protein Q8922_14855 [Bacteroidota bacterium]|nr:hypothetical protein [Bacteroidota bacterium]MDP4234498.1 hypothetical protein [Bacteroidota bacterium]MDP4243852.1 hypothetical protein [Bacteroidota bacterium]MDP4289196.1 hypothetical protein [Bacteroidota bacterium]